MKVIRNIHSIYGNISFKYPGMVRPVLISKCFTQKFTYLTVFEEKLKQSAQELAKQFNTSHISIIKYFYEIEKCLNLGPSSCDCFLA